MTSKIQITSPVVASKSKVAKPVNTFVQSRKLHTLGGQFTASAWVSIIFTVFALLASFTILNMVKTTFQEIVNNSAPSVIYARRLGQAIQAADAKALDYQLASQLRRARPADGFALDAIKEKTWSAFLEHRREVNDALFSIRVSATDVEESRTIKQIGDLFLNYVGKIDTMHYQIDQYNLNAAVELYKSAQDILVGNLNGATLDDKRRTAEQVAKLAGWPNFDPNKGYVGIEANIKKLSELNKIKLDKSNKSAQTLITVTLVVLLIFGTLLEGLRIFTCARYALITHRVFNVGYGLGLLGGLIMLGLLWWTLLQVNDAYTTMTNTTFGRMDAITKIRQLAADADADRSRLLLSHQAQNVNLEVREIFNPATLEENFNKKQGLIKDEIATAWKNKIPLDQQPLLCKVTFNPANKTVCNENSYSLDEYLKMDQQVRQQFTQSSQDNKEESFLNTISLNVVEAATLYTKFDLDMQDLAWRNEQDFDKSACSAIGYSQFGATCDGLAYLNVMRFVVWFVFIPIMVVTGLGWWLSRRMF